MVLKLYVAFSSAAILNCKIEYCHYSKWITISFYLRVVLVKCQLLGPLAFQ